MTGSSFVRPLIELDDLVPVLGLVERLAHDRAAMADMNGQSSL